MSFLEDVLASRRRAVARSKDRVPLDTLRSSPNVRAPRRPFAQALRTGRPSILAEIKHASPSAGELGIGDVAVLARNYERGGAAALSVVTEPLSFGGSLQDLAAARAACSLPVLRKDFIVDEYQVVESAAAGADAVLLIAAALDDAHLQGLRELAESMHMSALVEVHDEAEAQRALASGARIIGVNNRDLRTLKVDRTTALRVRAALRTGITLVAESGYQRAEEIAACHEAGFDAVLVGEALLRAPDPGAALRALRGVPV